MGGRGETVGGKADLDLIGRMDRVSKPKPTTADHPTDQVPLPLYRRSQSDMVNAVSAGLIEGSATEAILERLTYIWHSLPDDARIALLDQMAQDCKEYPVHDGKRRARFKFLIKNVFQREADGNNAFWILNYPVHDSYQQAWSDSSHHQTWSDSFMNILKESLETSDSQTRNAFVKAVGSAGATKPGFVSMMFEVAKQTDDLRAVLAMPVSSELHVPVWSDSSRTEGYYSVVNEIWNRFSDEERRRFLKQHVQDGSAEVLKFVAVRGGFKARLQLLQHLDDNVAREAFYRSEFLEGIRTALDIEVGKTPSNDFKPLSAKKLAKLRDVSKDWTSTGYTTMRQMRALITDQVDEMIEIAHRGHGPVLELVVENATRRWSSFDDAEKSAVIKAFYERSLDAHAALPNNQASSAFHTSAEFVIAHCYDADVLAEYVGLANNKYVSIALGNAAKTRLQALGATFGYGPNADREVARTYPEVEIGPLV